MLSYIHAFHAGNHADIIKHLTFSMVLKHLLKKDKPFTVIDTHSASGIYDLSDERLLKTGEAKSGIQKLFENTEFKKLKEIDSSGYFSIAEEYLKKGLYPGSPEIARCFMRVNDSLILNEFHPQVIKELKSNMKHPLVIQKSDIPVVSIHQRNASEMAKAVIPPVVKRGCVIIDPSYEDENDFTETTDLFLTAYKKWNTGTYLIWYPLLSHRESQIDRMKELITFTVEQHNAGNEDEKTLILELKVKEPEQMTGLAKLYGSGMIIVNPPYGLKEKAEEILPLLHKLLAE